MSNRVNLNRGNNVSPVAFLFACPGQKEEAAGKVVAGSTGKNLDKLLSLLSQSSNHCIKNLFPSANRYDYLITNASDIIHYPALDNRSLPSKKEYMDEANVSRLCNELKDVQYVIAFGTQAKDVSTAVEQAFNVQGVSTHPVFITSLPHLSFLSLNQISIDVNGEKIEKGDTDGTQKRLMVVEKKLEREVVKCV